MGKVIILDENTANKIAAGEVVERPASVVKELVENSIDAGAESISIEIKNGGISYIKVVDNGSGIEEDDLEIAFERHATSKIRHADDLESIITMGFRGEALASIAAVSTVEVSTRVREKPHGTYIKIQGGTVQDVRQTGCPVGTTFIVRDLFYNTPARFKFLKKDSTEAGYVSDLVSRIALANPHISFRLVSNHSQVLHTPGNNDLLSTIFSVYGKEVARQVVRIDYEESGIRVTGYAGKPEIARGTRSHQTIFVNGRYIKSKLVSSAIDEAYKTLLMKNKFAFIVLNIELNPLLIDINVHPTKMEVSFSEEQKIFRIVYHAVNNALLGTSLIRTVRLESKDSNIFKFDGFEKANGDFLQQDIYSGINPVLDKKKTGTKEARTEEAKRHEIEGTKGANYIAGEAPAWESGTGRAAARESFSNITGAQKTSTKDTTASNAWMESPGEKYNFPSKAEEEIDEREITDCKDETTKIDAREVTAFKDGADKSDGRDITAYKVEADKPDVRDITAYKDEADKSNVGDITAYKSEADKSNVGDITAYKGEADKSNVGDITAYKGEAGESGTRDVSAFKGETERFNARGITAYEREAQKIDINEFTASEAGSIKHGAVESVPSATGEDEFEEDLTLTNETGIGKAKAGYEEKASLAIDEDVKFQSSDAETFREVSSRYGEKTPEAEMSLSECTLVGQAFSTYIILQHKDELMLIDQHAAHERITYEAMKKKFMDNESLSQELLAPIVIEVTNQELKLLQEEREFFNKLGFIYEDFGNNSIILRSVPFACIDEPVKSVFLDVVDSVTKAGKDNYRKIADDAIYTMACKAAVKANKRLDEMEIRKILEDLDKLENPYTCPHGRPTIVRLTKYELEKMFKRIV